ncbi:MAG: hypothetical protein RLY89_830 [Bacteroidota bacterium]|jgi:hypothetical protein
MKQIGIAYNDHTLFHMLRHFESINDGAKDCLIKRGYGHQTMEAALQMPGSKFHAAFAQDLKMLEKQLTLGQKLSQETVGKYLQVQLSFDPVQFPQGIGNLGVVPFTNLSKLNARALVKKANRDVLLQHAIVDQLPPTWEMSLILKPQQNYYLLITAFPGTRSLSIPNTKMNDADFKASTLYWENHVFLELG